jgi:hypothetical protein
MPGSVAGRGRSESHRLLPLASIVATTAVAAAAGSLVGAPTGLRSAIAGSLILAVVGLGLTAPRRLLLLLVVWLAALGLVRRLVSQLEAPGVADPLLLVGPAAFTVLAVAAAERGAFRERTYLANAVLLLSALAVVGAFNPLQGSIVAGLAGLLFFLIPMLAFWIGRSLCDDALLARLLKLIAVLGVGVAVYGLFQTFVGFPAWDADWIRTTDNYQALRVETAEGETSIRPFATFSAASEFAYFAAIALLVWLVLGLTPSWFLFAAGAGVLLAASVFFQSSRGIVFVFLATAALTVAAARRLPIAPALLAAGVALILLPFAVSRLATPAVGVAHRSPLVSHQVEGLANPLHPESTLHSHASLVVGGLRSAVDYPLGRGVGSVSLAGSKFGQASGTEADVSNAAVALGIPGLLAYLLILVGGFGQMYRFAVRRGDRLSLLALAIVVLTTLQWLNGGQYAVAFLPWLVLGWMDRQRSLLDTPRQRLRRANA